MSKKRDNLKRALEAKERVQAEKGERGERGECVTAAGRRGT